MRNLAPDSEEMAACEALYELAKACPAQTAIAHLGAGKGCASVVLAYGSMDGNHVPVFAISATAEDKTAFLANILAAGERVRAYVSWVVMPYRKAAKRYATDVGLVLWDTGFGPKLIADFSAWSSWVVNGGIFAVHANKVGFPGLVDHAARTEAWMRGPSWNHGKIWTLRKYDSDDWQ
jgi:hypothetical protein